MSSMVHSGQEAVVPTAQAVSAATKAGRWVFTSACPKFLGPTNEVVGYDGSIHAGWQNSPSFVTREDYYTWAKAECSRLNTLEASAADLLEALLLILPLAKGYAPEGQSLTARQTCNSWITAAEDAIAKATGEASA